MFAVLTWSLSNVIGLFRGQWATWMVWGLAALAALMFFASVLAHELAHSLAARAQGLPVRHITLFIFGGVSNIQREPESPWGEFTMSIVGPLTSLAIGALLLLASGGDLEQAATFIRRPRAMLMHMDLFGALALWLGSVNVLLGLFNLTPAFPLDGGRVLRSFFWALTRNLKRATRWATFIGQGISWFFIVGGIAMIFGARIPLLGAGFVNGLWLAFIGWFLSNAATRSYRHVVIQDILADVPVSKIMRRDPPVVPPDVTVAALVHAHIMGSDDYGFPVLEQGRLVGLVTLDDVRRADRTRWDQLTVREIMTPRNKLATVTAQQDSASAFDVLMERDVRQLPVLENGELIGLLRRNDLVRWLQLQSRAEL